MSLPSFMQTIYVMKSIAVYADIAPKDSNLRSLPGLCKAVPGVVAQILMVEGMVPLSISSPDRDQ
jgi:hypothetical protein